MPRPWGMYTVIVFGLLAVCAYGAGPEIMPPDPIDLVEESAVAVTIGPDVIVGDLFQVASYGSSDCPGGGTCVAGLCSGGTRNGLTCGDISAFAVGTVSCNIGDVWINWFQNPSNQHPVIGQSMYRLKNDRFEHIGQSWLKHGFYALSQFLCFSDCVQNTDGLHLGVHCSDPYTASLNGTQSNLGPKYQVNAHTGYFPSPPANPSTPGRIARRLQVRNSDLDPSLDGGGLYFVEGQYVTPDDAAAGNQNNNASYRRVTVNLSGSTWTLLLVGTTQREQSAIRAWKDNDPSVVETDAQVSGDGLFILSAKVTDLGTGCFHYEYALQNLNSDRSGGSFTVPLPVGVTLDNIGFHDVDYHDGDGEGGQNWDGTDWPAMVEAGKITWATTPYSVNSRANALRWSTMYNFRFDANIGPAATTVTLGLFKPGTPSMVTIQTTGPRVDGVGLANCGLIDCQPNGIPDACDIDCGGAGCSSFPDCGGSSDCAIDALGHGNGIPDDCETDCQPPGLPGHGIPDECDIFSGRSNDCQPNGIPDECDILSGHSMDCQPNGIPDECETIGDCDGDGVDDCHDLCPCTTPVNACLPPFNQLVICCFPSGIYTNILTWTVCLNSGGIPVCDDPPICPGTRCRDSQCRDGCLLGDWDRDGDQDLFDVDALQTCFSGSTGNPAYVAPSAECLLRFDFDNDGDVDNADYKEFLATYTGP